MMVNDAALAFWDRRRATFERIAPVLDRHACNRIVTEAMEHLLIADTNLFFECLRLEDLPWAELGLDSVVIALTKPVIGEIDKHKNGGGRTRKRALDINGRIRSMLVSGQSESGVREASPRVVLRLMPVIPPASELEGGLDYKQNDDRIVGIASTLSRGERYASVSLLTHDTAAASTAKAVGVSFRLIPDSWLRPPEETTEAKRIKELEKDLATYRSQEPLIALREVEGEATAHVVRRIAQPLPPAAIDRLIDQLLARHAMRTDFTVPASRRLPDGTEISYEAPDPSLVEAYTSRDYPSWVAGCRSILETLHERCSQREQIVKLRFGVINNGTRPASKVRISFEAFGNIHLYRRSKKSDGDADKQDTAVPTLASPPSPPSFRRIVKPSTPSLGGSPRALSDTLRRSLTNLDTVGSLVDAHRGLNVLSRTAAIGEAMRYVNQLGALNQGAARITSIEPPIIPRLAPHDPESFYYDWRSDAPVKRGSLTCDLFRHRGEEEIFEVEVSFPLEGDARGSVLCIVHAENLTEPVSLRIPVSRSIETYALLKTAEDMVVQCR